jgi:predicted phage-related endonuclease
MFNASDAPAMMGCSAYKTRSQLLHERATGQVPEVDAGTQRRFDEGHRIEALARPLAEKIVGQELYPQVGSEGEHSASFDGLSMDESENFEHKTLNDELRAAFADIETIAPECRTNEAGRHLPEQYRVQMEQQHMVSGCTRTLFMASKWNGDTLVEENHCWYYTDMALRAKLIAGWAQFKQDLSAYQAPEVIIPAVAEPQLSLPAVSIAVSGQIALVDNLDKFGAALTAYIAKLNRKPKTDQDFANLEDAVKRLKAAEEQLDAAEASALGQTDSIDTMRRTVALHRETAKTTRLLIDKLVKAEKENRRTAIVSDAVAELVAHVKKLNDRLGKPYMPTIVGDFQGVIKGLKSLDSMKDKVAGELARCKIAANEAADRIQANLTTLRELASEHTFLFADAYQLVGKANDDLTALVKSRIAEQAERDRIAADAAKVERIVTAPDIATVTPPGPAAAAVPFEAVVAIMPATVRKAMAPKPATPPSLRIGEIANRLGFGITESFLRTMEFPPAGKQGASVLYHEADFPAICQALIAHIAEVSEQFDAVAA